MKSVKLSGFAQGALAESVSGQFNPGAQLGLAIRFYLRDRGGSPAWPYPEFLRDSEASADSRSVAVEVDDAEWAAFEAEAERQRVSIDQLAEHAAIYLAGAREAGHLARRIREAIEDAGTERSGGGR